MATLAELIGDHPKTCGHDLSNESSFTLITPGEEDFVWLVQHLDHVDDTATSIRVCSKCRDALPSEVEKKAQQQRRAKQQQEAADLARADKIAELKESGQKIYECSECNELTGEDELIQIRWCSHCQQSFSGTDSGRNCEQCNRPFTRKVTDEGCPECVNNYDEDDDGRVTEWKRWDKDMAKTRFVQAETDHFCEVSECVECTGIIAAKDNGQGVFCPECGREWLFIHHGVDLPMAGEACECEIDC